MSVRTYQQADRTVDLCSDCADLVDPGVGILGPGIGTYHDGTCASPHHVAIPMVDRHGRSLEVDDEVRIVNPADSFHERGFIRRIQRHDHDPRTHGKVQATLYFPAAQAIGHGYTSIDLTFHSRRHRSTR